MFSKTCVTFFIFNLKSGSDFFTCLGLGFRANIQVIVQTRPGPRALGLFRLLFILGAYSYSGGLGSDSGW